MTRWRWLRAGLLAGFAAAAALLWPPRPLWQVPTRDEHMHHYSPDGRCLIGSRRIDGSLSDRFAVVTRDAATGREVSAVRLAALDDRIAPVASVVPSPDGRRALVVKPRTSSWGWPSFTGVGWQLSDATTGARLTPLATPDADHLDVAFSPDGRWFMVAWRPDPNKPEQYARTVYDATTGAEVVAFTPTAAEHPARVTFRPDGSAAAVIWQTRAPASPAAPACRADVVALPSGTVTKRFALPPTRLVFAALWRGDRLWVELLMPAPTPAGSRWGGYEIDTTADPAGPAVALAPDPMLSGLGDGWTTHVDGPDPRLRYQQRDKAAAIYCRVLAWLADKTLLIYERPAGAVMRLRIVDVETGVPVAGPTAWFDGYSVVAPDAKWVAVQGDRSLALWPTTPRPRWPVALLAVAAALVLNGIVERGGRFWGGVQSTGVA